MKKTFGLFEVVFDIAYLLVVLTISCILFLTSDFVLIRIIAGLMSLVLVFGDAFHLLPRITAILKINTANTQYFLGLGKQVSSITMTIFYLLLWHIGLSLFVVENYLIWTIFIYLLGVVRVILCLLPQNKWTEKNPPYLWSFWRNIPFIVMGIMIAILFCLNRNIVPSLSNVWLAVSLSFAFYLPVVFLSHKNAKVGMLMLPKSAMYVWLLFMFVFI